MKVQLDDILYIESDNVYIYVHTQQNKLLVRSTLQHYMELIGQKNFFRVHRSFAVNINHIESINAENVFIKGREIPIGRTFREELLTLLRLG